MLSQKFQRRDAEEQREKRFIYRDKGDKRGYEKPKSLIRSLLSPSSLLNIALRLCVSAFVLASISCGSKPTDLRAVIPADALVYLETNDLGKAIAAITQNKSFQQLAKTQPDTSALNGIKLSIAVTGFQTSEQAVTEENSVLNFQPRFVAVAETNAWNYQALSFTENKLGEFINETYGGEVTLKTSDKHGGKYFVWTAQDGRKAYALVRGSLIFFGNDESAIDKCLAVARGEADSIAKNPKITALSADSLASGYVSTDGVAQISNITGVKLASESAEEAEVQSAIAGIVPQILRGSIREITWTTRARYHDNGTQVVGFSDSVIITTNPEVISVLSETLVPSDRIHAAIEFLPLRTPKATLYNLKDPQVAWKSVLLIAQKQIDPRAEKVTNEFSSILSEPYGIRDPEMFLSGVETNILTANFDFEGDKPVTIAEIIDADKVRKALMPEIKLSKQSTTETGVEIWKSEDGDLSAAFVDTYIVVGDAESVLKCIQAKHNPVDGKLSIYGNFLGEPKKSVVTVGFDNAAAERIARVFGETMPLSTNPESFYITETSFSKSGIERRTVSDFGLIGSIIEQLGKDN